MTGKVILTNKDCAFKPRVDTITVGQTLILRNDDPMLHNTHIRNGKRTFVNVAQVVGGRQIEKLVKAPGLLNVKCDKHKFMQGYLVAFDHPYFAITNKTGQFRIVDVPPGRWTITVWHETLGSLTASVMVPDRGTMSVNMEFPAN